MHLPADRFDEPGATIQRCVADGTRLFGGAGERQMRPEHTGGEPRRRHRGVKRPEGRGCRWRAGVQWLIEGVALNGESDNCSAPSTGRSGRFARRHAHRCSPERGRPHRDVRDDAVDGVMTSSSRPAPRMSACRAGIAPCPRDARSRRRGRVPNQRAPGRERTRARSPIRATPRLGRSCGRCRRRDHGATRRHQERRFRLPPPLEARRSRELEIGARHADDQRVDIYRETVAAHGDRRVRGATGPVRIGGT